MNAMIEAIKQNRPTEVEKILKRPGQYVNVPIGNSGRPPLHFAIQENRKGVARLLVSNFCADVNMTDGDDYTPLMIAIDKGNADLARWLIDMGADTTGKYPNGRKFEQCTENKEILELLRTKKTDKY